MRGLRGAGIVGVGCAALVLVGACAAGTAPTSVPPSSATSSFGSADAGPVPTTPSTADPAQTPGGFTIGDLVGTWTGKVFVRGWDVSTVNGSQIVNPSKDTTWATTATIGQCWPGATCGSIAYATQDAWGTGRAASCQGTLRFRGQNASRGDFEFDETIASRTGAVAATSTSRNCRNSILVITPLASRTTVAVEETDNAELDYGVLVKAATP